VIITIDEGTTSTRALLISKTGEILDSVQKEITQIYLQPGWVQHDALEIWNLTLTCCKELIQKTIASGKVKADDFEGIAITNQRETTVIWDKNTGKPVYDAIVWQCKRTSDYCKSLKSQKKLSEYINQKTGLIVDSYFSATKISWILDHVVRINKDIKIDDLLFGTIDTWLVWNLTGKHLTDTSNASRTMLYDIHEDKWDDLLLATFGIPKTLMPEVLASNASFGSTKAFASILGKDLEIKAVLGDQQAAFYAYNCEAKITYGTGTFVLLPHSGDLAKGLVLTNAYKKTSSEKKLGFEGSIFVGGSIVQWLRDELNFISSSSEIESLAAQVKDNGGVYLIPALAGLGAPYWDENARGAIFGLTRGSNKAYIARAALESMAYSVRDVFEALDEKTKNSIDYINVDGGASKNNFLMQFQADLLQKPIRRFTETEMTALGVAKMTGLVELNLKPERIFEPQNNLDNLYNIWKRYINLLINI
jgi:glycerol kinase